jgi:hypothetical protein
MKSIVKLTGLSFLFIACTLNSCKKEGVPPTVETSPITNVTISSASCGGTVTSEGSGIVIARGICWAAKPNPTINDLKTLNGSGLGSFTSSITGLYGGIAYFVRAYATNSAGTGYGIARSFIATGQSPAVIVAAATNIISTGATLNGYVNAYSLATVITFEYGPTSIYGKTITASQSPLSENTEIQVSASISGLTPSTLYHYRIIATNSLGTVFSNDITFTTPGP